MRGVSITGHDHHAYNGARGSSARTFTRKDIAAQLGIKAPQLKDGFKAARQAGELEKIRDDESGTGHFRLADR